LFGGVLRNEAAAEPPALAPQAPALAADAALSGFSFADTESLVVQLQQELEERPGDAETLGLLGLAYQQRARETGDPSYYTKAEGVLREALAAAPDDLLAVSGLGTLALARHDFRGALDLGERALALSTSSARPYGIMGDALIELGRYEEAFDAFDRMAELKPNVASYARVSYARELLGDVDGAIYSMELAVDAARGTREPSAWTLVQLGKLYFSSGRFDEARGWYDRALQIFPGYVYGLEALAHVEAASGDLPAAIAHAKRAVDSNPLPQFVILLGDLYTAIGEDALAQEQYELVDAIHQLLAESGVRTDLEIALYRADRALEPEETVALARAAHADRPSIEGGDTLSWALARAGQCTEARAYSQQALRLGTRDATKLFHRGMIELCLGNRDGARRWLDDALELNPGFSVLLAREAQAALAEATA
jgi:tetratricopeptide (TPR) repeat protein